MLGPPCGYVAVPTTTGPRWRQTAALSHTPTCHYNKINGNLLLLRSGDELPGWSRSRANLWVMDTDLTGMQKPYVFPDSHLVLVEESWTGSADLHSKILSLDTNHCITT